MAELKLRLASAEDLPHIMDLQVQVFTGEQCIPEEMVRAVQNAKPTWYCAELDGVPAGTVAVWQENGETHWGRFAVRPDLRGHGIGTALARYSLEQSFSRGIRRICMEAREATVHIICKMGGQVTGEAVPFFVGTVTPVEISAADFEKRSNSI